MTFEEANEYARQLDIFTFLEGYGLEVDKKRPILRCPLHVVEDSHDGKENTPSFHIYADTNTWYCFGCNTGGNAITFVMEYEQCSFYEALNRLKINKPTSRLQRLRNRLTAHLNPKEASKAKPLLYQSLYDLRDLASDRPETTLWVDEQFKAIDSMLRQDITNIAAETYYSELQQRILNQRSVESD